MSADGNITVYVVPGLMPKASDEVKRHMILHKYENYKNMMTLDRILELSLPTVSKQVLNFSQAVCLLCIAGIGGEMTIT